MVLFEGSDRRGAALRVRHVVSGDARTSLRLMQRLLGETAFMLRTPAEHGGTSDDEVRFIRQLAESPNSAYLMAEVEGRAAGLMILSGGSLRRLCHVVYLGMGVLSSHWGTGVGSALMTSAQQCARATRLVRRVSLQVYATNHRAIALYEKFGFVLEGRLRREVFLGDEGFVDMLQMAWFVS